MHLLVLSVILVVVNSQCTGKVNTLPIYDLDPTLVNTVQNGKLFTTGSVTPKINVIHVYGTPYEMGYAQGQLIKGYGDALVNKVYKFIVAQVAESLPNLPEPIRDYIAQFGIDAALDLTYEATRYFTPQRFYDELRGLADGSGFDYNTLLRVHMFPELTQASCSMMGTWGSAVTKIPGPLYQLRALDWTTDGPFQDYPALIVYHPTDGHDFAIWSFAGFIGGLTGMSSAPVAISQKVWLTYNGTQNRFGIPFYFLLRDILQYDLTIDDAMSRIINSERTCSIFVGLGDPSNKFRALEYSFDYVNVYDDINYPLYQNHPRYNNVVYIDKHEQPSHNPCLSTLIQQHYGSLGPETMIRYIAAQLQTGDTHAAVYDFGNNLMYITVASPYVNGTFTPAYDRPWTKIDLTKAFNEAHPTDL